MFVKQLDDRHIVVGAPAKVNLFLQVLNRRPDGYHNIYSLFQTVSLFDRLKVSRSDINGIDLTLANDRDLSSGPDNLIVKAWNLMQLEYRLSGGLKVSLEKNIPIGAGLGGGSSDCAATILACNLLFGLKLEKKQLMQLGAKLGSDVPFFFTCGQALASGRGELLDETHNSDDYWIVLVTPNFQISTANSYAALSLTLTHEREKFMLSGYRTADELVESLRHAGNDFEANHLIVYPEIGQIRDRLLNSGARLARLSGSGPTVFGIYREAPGSELEGLSRERDWQLHVVRPVAQPDC
jgi:4-diphosphocytidyl-2-C-methyl-D-erythritol kinase